MKKQPRSVPVYLIAGFLDSGKTNFLKYTLQQDYFNDGSKSLLLLCEEGEEEYPQAMLKKTKTDCVTVDGPEGLTAAALEKYDKQYKPDRVLVEYNGMWSVQDLLNTPLPGSWAFYQIITILDGSAFKLYLNNIRKTAVEMLTNADMVIFNRCTADDPDLVTYQRALRSVNGRAELIFEDKDGQELEAPEPDLPYSLDDPVIVISDENYGSFYIDLDQHPERYINKKVRFLAQIMQDKKFPENVFVAGRRAMTCCVEDIRFLPYLFVYDRARSIANNTWAEIQAEIKWEFHEIYQEEGPVFYVDELKVVTRPKEELIYF